MMVSQEMPLLPICDLPNESLPHRPATSLVGTKIVASLCMSHRRLAQKGHQEIALCCADARS